MNPDFERVATELIPKFRFLVEQLCFEGPQVVNSPALPWGGLVYVRSGFKLTLEINIHEPPPYVGCVVEFGAHIGRSRALDLANLATMKYGWRGDRLWKDSAASSETTPWGVAAARTSALLQRFLPMVIRDAESEGTGDPG